MHTTTVAMWAPAPCCIDSQNLISRHSVESMQHGAGAHMATVVVCILYWWKYLAEDNEEERDNHSIVSLNEYISV